MHRIVELLQAHPLTLHVWSREKAECETLPDVHAMISITDSGGQAALPECSQRKDVLRLSFADLEREQGNHKPISPADADCILDFVAKALESGIGVLVVHCEAGVSRSAAVAAALAAIQGESPLRFWQSYIPNARVFNLVLRAAVLVDPELVSWGT